VKLSDCSLRLLMAVLRSNDSRESFGLSVRFKLDTDSLSGDFLFFLSLNRYTLIPTMSLYAIVEGYSLVLIDKEC